MLGERKVFLLGIDGLPPDTLRRFVAAGRMPRFARLLERAVVFDAIPTLPALTCPGWLSIASGARPSTIGVENILLPSPGQAPDVIRNGFNSGHGRAEYIWETLARHGLDAVVLKYPGSWPPRAGDFVQVDGAGGYADISCQFEAVASQAYVVGARGDSGNNSHRPILPAGYEEYWRVDTGPGGSLTEVVARDPVGWRGLEPDAQPGFECILHVGEVGRRSTRPVHALAYSRAGKPHLVLSRDKDVRGDALNLTPGSWSDWTYESSPAGPYAYRYKLLDLDIGQRRLHLYRTEGHRLRHFTKPESLAEELVNAVGPVVEWTGTYDLMSGLVDLETQLEIYEQHTSWLARAIRHLARSRTWHGFFTHWHIIEYAHHLVGASIHPEHPLHSPQTAARDIEFLARTYELADELLKAVEDVIDQETLLVVASDHGHDLLHSIFYANHFLGRHGWLATTWDNGRRVIDWSRTKAYALFPGCVFFNAVGRWPGGIVGATEFGGLTTEITQALRGLTDPRTGQHPIKIILDRAELAAYGQVGAQTPDLMFCMDRGYEVASRITGDDGAAEFEVTVPYREATSGHGSFFPASNSARTLAILARVGGAPPPRSPYPVSVLDLAPTMTAYLGIPPPSHCEGHAIDY